MEYLKLIATCLYVGPQKEKTGIVLAVIAEVFTVLFGGWDKLLTTLIMMMVFDYISGIMVALKGRSNKTGSGKLSSKAGWEGLLKKGGTLLVVLVACRLDLMAAQYGYDLFLNIRAVVIGFYIGVEGISLLENVNALDPNGKNIPPIFKRLLQRLLDNADDNIDDPAGGNTE